MRQSTWLVCQIRCPSPHTSCLCSSCSNLSQNWIQATSFVMRPRYYLLRALLQHRAGRRYWSLGWKGTEMNCHFHNEYLQLGSRVSELCSHQRCQSWIEQGAIHFQNRVCYLRMECNHTRKQHPTQVLLLSHMFLTFNRAHALWNKCNRPYLPNGRFAKCWGERNRAHYLMLHCSLKSY